MKPIHFKESNEILAKNQPEYLPLPVFRVSSNEGEIISCWHLSFFERLKLLLTGRLWIWALTFNTPLQPQLPSVNHPFSRLHYKWIGEWRLLWGFCPACNSDAPEKDNCSVCMGYGKMHNDIYPPSKVRKQQWRKLWKKSLSKPEVL